MNREDYPAAKAVDERLILFSAGRESCLQQKIALVSCFLRFHREGIALFQAVAQLEFFDDIVPEAPFSEVGEADSLSFGMGVQYFHKIIAGILVEDEHALPVALCLLLLVGELLFDDFDIVFARNVFQCLVIGKLLMFHHEVDGRSPFTADKAFTDVFRWGYIKGGSVVVMKRT